MPAIASRLALLTAAYLLMSISLEELATALKAVQALLKQNAPMTQDEVLGRNCRDPAVPRARSHASAPA